MLTSQILAHCAQQLREAGVAEPRFEAEVLAAYAANVSRAKIVAMFPDQYPPEARETLEKICARRVAREPFAYITGTKEFYGIDFDVDRNVLVPRPETEALVDAAVARVPESGSFLDLCCGSGNVGIALKSLRGDISVTAADISPAALDVARRNARRVLGDGCVKFVQSDLFESIDGRFDMIAANPPYVAQSESVRLEPELSYEPHSALFSADEGLFHTKKIIESADRYLNSGGLLLIETNPSLRETLMTLAAENGYNVEAENDLAGFSRFFYFTRDR